MFDLESTIQNWKQAFGKDDAVGPAEILELETHLRELVVDLGKHGLSEREAFMVGADRLGHPSELEQEYTKVNFGARWRSRVFWMLSGYIAMTVASGVVSALVAMSGAGLAYTGIAGSTAGVGMVAVMVLAWCGLIYFAYQSQGFEIRNRNLWFVAAGIILIVAPVIAFGGQIAQTRFVDLSWYGESTMYRHLGATAAHFVIVAICFIAMCVLSRHVTTAVQAE